jgi:hypothetical protein
MLPGWTRRILSRNSETQETTDDAILDIAAANITSDISPLCSTYSGHFLRSLRDSDGGNSGFITCCTRNSDGERVVSAYSKKEDQSGNITFRAFGCSAKISIISSTELIEVLKSEILLTLTDLEQRFGEYFTGVYFLYTPDDPTHPGILYSEWHEAFRYAEQNSQISMQLSTVFDETGSTIKVKLDRV